LHSRIRGVERASNPAGSRYIVLGMTMTAVLLVLVYVGPAALGVYHALLYKRDPRAAMGWIMACLFIPYGGPIAYFLFGINRVRSRGQGLRRRFPHVGYESGARRALSSRRGELGLRDAGLRITGRELSNGNASTPLINGDEAYPEMLEAIAGAKERVFLATYILKLDDTGREFADALAAAVSRGVDVRVLIDGFGEYYAFRNVAKALRKRGVRTARFLPPRLIPPSIHMNLRNHRKILLADDTVAFAGGMNIGDNHRAREDRPREVADVHFALRGPVVAELGNLFRSDWHFATDGADPVVSEEPGEAAGDMDCRIVPDGPNEELDSLAATIQTAISAARRSVDIMTPYFLPGRDLMASLESAALRGARVRLVLPGSNNLPYMHWANRNALGELLRWDIEACYQAGPFNHAKLLCIDDAYSLIGSANLDSRSLRLNFELGIEVFSEELNGRLREYFERSLEGSERITWEDLQNRSLAIRLRDSAAALMSPYM